MSKVAQHRSIAYLWRLMTVWHNPGLQATAATEDIGSGEAEKAAAPEPQC